MHSYAPRVTPRRQAAALALVGYSVVLATVLLSPTSAPGTSAVETVSELMSDVGVPASLADATRVEVALNVAIFVPWAALAAVVWPAVTWQAWTAYGFVVTGLVETAQALVLGSARSAAYSDVVANTLGALLGAGLVSLVRAWTARRGAG